MWSGIKNPVCYLSAEFGIDNDLPTYSGGLGILASDIISEAASTDYPFIGIGILYKGVGFVQHITGDGKMETRDSEFDHDASFLRQTTLNGKPLVLEIDLKNEKVCFKSYHIRLSDNTILFFLSTDLDTNPKEWISDMDALYGGVVESQIRQQILLGIGGIKLLQALSITPKVFHLNEGRPALVIWELTKNLIEKENLAFSDAWKKAKEKIVYTNHTLVAAGNLVYSIEPIKKYASPFAQDLKIEVDELIKDGITYDGNFSITQFALKISSKHSAVSIAHADNALITWPDFNWVAITNGIYTPRWQDSDFRKNLSDLEIWDLHQTKKRELVNSIVQRTGVSYDPNRLVISWARRLAEYKQPKIIFADIERLKKILTSTKTPVQLIFAGNSHTADMQSKSIIEDVIKIFSGELSGHAIFAPNYNITLANHLVSGSDIWLNTPQGNLEACGTSGMKAASNGVLNFTVLDGWTYEVDWKDRGFVLDAKNIAENFYKTLENEIIPLFYERNQDGIPLKWISMMKNSIKLSEKYSTLRVLEDYKQKLYL